MLVREPKAKHRDIFWTLFSEMYMGEPFLSPQTDRRAMSVFLSSSSPVLPTFSCTNQLFLTMSTLQHVTTLRGHEEDTRVWHAAWSNNGKFLATCGEDKTIRIWTTSFGCEWTDENSRIECIATLEEAQARTVRSCEWSPDDRMIASASFDGTVVVWETQSSGMTVWDQIATLEGHDNEVKSVAWCPHGQWLASCGRDKRVWIWEMVHGTEFECVAMLEGHTQDVKFVRWHPTAPAMLLSASYDDTIKVNINSPYFIHS